MTRLLVCAALAPLLLVFLHHAYSSLKIFLRQPELFGAVSALSPWIVRFHSAAFGPGGNAPVGRG